MIHKIRFFVLSLLVSLIGCGGSLAPITDTTANDDAILGDWRGCQGTRLVVSKGTTDYGLTIFHPRHGENIFNCDTRKMERKGTYNLRLLYAGGQEFADLSQACSVDGFVTLHEVAKTRHDGDDLLIEALDTGWFGDEAHLKASGITMFKEKGNWADDIYITSPTSEVQEFLAHHPNEPGLYEGDQDATRLKRHWSKQEAEGCSE